MKRSSVEVPEMGSEWAYRIGDTLPSQHVRVLSVTLKKQSFWVNVEFLEGVQAGQQADVPGSRLRARWEKVKAYDELTANWDRFAEYKLDDVERDVGETTVDPELPPLPEPIRYDNGGTADSMATRLTLTTVQHILEVFLRQRSRAPNVTWVAI